MAFGSAAARDGMDAAIGAASIPVRNCRRLGCMIIVFG
jgi:hypothetical protein